MGAQSCRSRVWRECGVCAGLSLSSKGRNQESSASSGSSCQNPAGHPGVCTPASQKPLLRGSKLLWKFHFDTTNSIKSHFSLWLLHSPWQILVRRDRKCKREGGDTQRQSHMHEFKNNFCSWLQIQQPKLGGRVRLGSSLWRRGKAVWKELNPPKGILDSSVLTITFLPLLCPGHSLNSLNVFLSLSPRGLELPVPSWANFLFS